MAPPGLVPARADSVTLSVAHVADTSEGSSQPSLGLDRAWTDECGRVTTVPAMHGATTFQHQCEISLGSRHCTCRTRSWCRPRASMKSGSGDCFIGRGLQASCPRGADPFLDACCVRRPRSFGAGHPPCLCTTRADPRARSAGDLSFFFSSSFRAASTRPPSPPPTPHPHPAPHPTPPPAPPHHPAPTHLFPRSLTVHVSSTYMHWLPAPSGLLSSQHVWATCPPLLVRHLHLAIRSGSARPANGRWYAKFTKPPTKS